MCMLILSLVTTWNKTIVFKKKTLWQMRIQCRGQLLLWCCFSTQLTLCGQFAEVMNALRRSLAHQSRRACRNYWPTYTFQYFYLSLPFDSSLETRLIFEFKVSETPFVAVMPLSPVISVVNIFFIFSIYVSLFLFRLCSMGCQLLWKLLVLAMLRWLDC